MVTSITGIPIMPSPKLKKVIGALFGVSAVITSVLGWQWLQSSAETYTDNAYIRGDVTSVAPRVSGYVTSVEVEDNQPVKAGDILFRIDDRDYRAKLAQAEANVVAARARLANVEAETQLQHSLIRQAEAQQRSTMAELDLATRVSDRRRQLIRSSTVSQAQVDESDAARSRAESGLSAASATVEAQNQRIAVFGAQREAAVAAVAQAEAARDLARIDLDSTVVHAPVAGVVGNRQVRVGRLVAPGVAVLDIVPIEVAAGDAVIHHGRVWHGSGSNSASVPRRALVSHCLSSDCRFHETEVSYIYSRYRRRGDLAMDESFFPILWRADGYRTPWLDPWLAA